MSVESLSEGLNQLAARLSQDHLAPDPSRSDWDVERSALDDLHRIAKNQVLMPLTGALAELDPNNAAEARQAVAHSISQAAAVLIAAGDDRAHGLLRQAVPLADGDDFAAAIRDAERDPTGFAWLNFAFWSLNNGTDADADRAARRAMKSDSDAIKTIAKAIDARPRELASAPGLGSINGVGLTVYGSRDPIEDTYITTRYFIVVFIPIFAIDAFRVRKAPGDGWYFLAKEKLGPIATWWRRLLMIGIAGAIAFSIFQSTYNSPKSRANRAIAAAQAEADPVAAQRQLFVDFPRHEHHHLRPAAADLVNRLLATAPKAVAPADAPQVATILRTFNDIPAPALSTPSRQAMIDTLVGWAGTQDPLDTAQAAFADQLLTDATRISGSQAKSGVGAVRDAQRIAQAKAIAKEWPLDALRLLAQIRDPGRAVADAEAIVAPLPADASVWQELSTELNVFLKAGRNLKVPVARLEAIAKQAAALKPLTAEQTEAIAKQNLDALTAAVKVAPHDERLAAGLAQAQATNGQFKAALATLDGLGPRGFLGARARPLAAQLLIEAGQAEAADALLTYHLQGRRPGYEAARDGYMKVAKALEDRLIGQARRGQLPRSIELELRGKSESKQQEIFSDWLRKRLESDASIKRARETWLAYQDIVPIALQLGTLKLQRAQGMTGAEREQLLTQAETILLSIQGEAGGTTEYQLQLGQVYFRTGKREKGEAEFKVLLDRKDPDLKIQVASAYRFVGEATRSRTLLEEVVASSSDPIKTRAATALTAMAETLEDREKWIGEASDLSEEIRTQRAQIQAERLLYDGKLSAADKKFAEVVRLLSKQANTNAAAANNAANAEADRYQCTGDIKRMYAAAKLMDTALRLMPDNSVVNSNASTLQGQVAELDLLAPHVDLAALRLRGYESGMVLSALLLGPMRAALMAEGRRSPRVRRIMRLSERAFALAPGATAGYISSLKWATFLNDAKAMKRLADRAENAPLDTASYQAAVLTNAGDPDAVKQHATRVKTLEARPAKTPQTKAVRAFLLAYTHQSLAHQTGSLPAAQKALAAMQTARKLWPVLVPDGVLSDFHLDVGVFTIADSHSDLKDRLAELHWSSSIGLLWRVGKASAPVRAAIAKNPALREAVRLWRTPVEPLISGWMLAKMVGDQAAQAAHQAVFNLPLVQDRLRLRARLTPDPTRLAQAAILKAGPEQAF